MLSLLLLRADLAHHPRRPRPVIGSVTGPGTSPAAHPRNPAPRVSTSGIL